MRAVLVRQLGRHNVGAGSSATRSTSSRAWRLLTRSPSLRTPSRRGGRKGARTRQEPKREGGRVEAVLLPCVGGRIRRRDGQVPDPADAVHGARTVHRLVAHVPHLREAPARDPARRAVGRSTSPEQIEAARHAFGLDQPLYVQYARFAKGLIPWPGLFLTEDVYYSYGNFVPVKEEIFRRLPVTITLALGAAVIWLADRHPDRDHLGRAARNRLGPRRHGLRAVRRLGAGVLARYRLL